jgi:hypothetical protein
MGFGEDLMKKTAGQIKVGLLAMALVLVLGCYGEKAFAGSHFLVDNQPVAMSGRYASAGKIGLHSVRAEAIATGQHTIIVSSKGNGLVSPEGASRVEHGAVKSFTFLPDNGYRVAAIRIDGELFETVDSYTFINVNADHAIEVLFAKDAEQSLALADPEQVDGEAAFALLR